MTEQSPDAKKQDIREWWAKRPMTYGFVHGDTEYIEDGQAKQVDFGSKAFFEQADKTFYEWNKPLHTSKGNFGKIFDYDRFQGKDVLEVGCGMGCMAMNWAQHGANITATDLNPVAIEQTKSRFDLYGLNGTIQEADGENLSFDDASFDYAYSWGVLHHTPKTKQAIDDLWRVLQVGGSVGVMLYHRHSFLYQYWARYMEGLVGMENKFLTPVELGSRYGDGARQGGNPHTWPITKKEAYQLFDKFSNVRVRVLGTELPDILNLMHVGFGKWLPLPMKKALARRWGWSLWITGDKLI